MSLLRSLICALLVCTGAWAQSLADFSLNMGMIAFKAPTEWPAIMQKTEGDPQFMAFQVRDPADQGTQEATRVTVETKQLADAGDFQSFVNTGLDKAKQTPGYEPQLGSADSSRLRYFGMNGRIRYEYQEAFFLNGHIAIHVRCTRPMLAATTKAWTESYEKGCSQIMQSLKP